MIRTEMTPVFMPDNSLQLRLPDGSRIDIRRPDGSPLREGDLRPGQPIRVDDRFRLVALGNRAQRRRQLSRRARRA